MPELDDFAGTLVRRKHRKVFDYWRSLAPPCQLPGRQHFDPLDLPDLLANIILYDVVREDGRMRIRFRLVGTDNVQRYGRDATGLWFEEAYEGDVLKAMLDTYCGVAETGAPSLTHNRMPIKGKEFVEYDRLILPFASDGETADMLLSLMVFEDQ